MRVIYVSGPITHPDIWGRKKNIDYAMDVAREYWKQGYAVICPHSNTYLMDGHDVSWETFLAGDFELIRRSDAVVMLPGWEDSKGARAELDFARELGKEIFFWEEERSE